MRQLLLKPLKYLAILLLAIIVTILGVRLYDSQRGLPLEAWHRYVPQELSIEAMDSSDWSTYIDAENALFEAVKTNVTQKLSPNERIPVNRYFSGSPVYPPHLPTDWNHSYILEPYGEPLGAVVLLHGLTDSPYSLRHIARRFQAHGYVSVAIRLPAHGTVPGALTAVKWPEWMAATRLAIREARRRIGPSRPLHLIGFSNGGALALKYSLDSIEDKTLTRADRIVLISPMIGITRFARFAGLAGLPALLPAFAKAAWLSVSPEFNPFKYNSFPTNAARQSHLLTVVLQQQIARLARNDKLKALPPTLTFQSVMDFTVSTRAIVNSFYALLPANGSELVLFDVNRSRKFGLLLRPSADVALSQLLPKPPREYRATIITNANPDTGDMVERITDAHSTKEVVKPIGLSYPFNVYSLSHVALPFPLFDPLYGLEPDLSENYGIRLGSTATRGERNVLIVSLDSLLRLSSNPFFAYMIAQIEKGIEGRTQSQIMVSYLEDKRFGVSNNLGAIYVNTPKLNKVKRL